MVTYDEMDASEIEASPPPNVCAGAAGVCPLFDTYRYGYSATEVRAYYAALDAADTCQEAPNV